MASKQIDKHFALLRERFCLEWIKGELGEAEIREQLAFLRIPGGDPDYVGVIRWPEQSKGKAFFSEKDRQLLLFAIENIMEEHLEPFTSVHFRDNVGLIVVLIWGKPQEAVFRRIESDVAGYLKIELVASYRNGSSGDVPSLYAEARASVNRETRLSPFVRRTKEIISRPVRRPGLVARGNRGRAERVRRISEPYFQARGRDVFCKHADGRPDEGSDSAAERDGSGHTRDRREDGLRIAALFQHGIQENDGSAPESVSKAVLVGEDRIPDGGRSMKSDRLLAITMTSLDEPASAPSTSPSGLRFRCGRSTATWMPSIRQAFRSCLSPDRMAGTR